MLLPAALQADCRSLLSQPREPQSSLGWPESVALPLVIFGVPKQRNSLFRYHQGQALVTPETLTVPLPEFGTLFFWELAAHSRKP